MADAMLIVHPIAEMESASLRPRLLIPAREIAAARLTVIPTGNAARMTTAAANPVGPARKAASVWSTPVALLIVSVKSAGQMVAEVSAVPVPGAIASVRKTSASVRPIVLAKSVGTTVAGQAAENALTVCSAPKMSVRMVPVIIL